MYCEKCGKPLKNDDRFCSGCGKANPDALLEYADPAQIAEGYQNIQNMKTVPEPQANLEFRTDNPISSGPDLNEINKKRNNRLVAGIIIAAVLVPVITVTAALASFSVTKYSSKIINQDVETDISYNDEVIDEYENENPEYSFSPLNQIEQQVIWESGDVTITAQKLEHKGEFYSNAELQIMIENNSSSDVSISTDYCTVNDFMISSSMYAEVPAGKKQSTCVYMDIDDLNSAGIENINEFSVLFRMFDSETFKDIDVSESITVTTLNDNHDEPENFTGKTVFDKNDVKIDFLGISEYSDRKTIDLLVENNSDNLYNLSLRNLSVNDCMMDVYSGLSVNSGKKRIEHIYIPNDALSEYEIYDINYLEFSFLGTTGYNYDKAFETGNIIIEVD